MNVLQHDILLTRNGTLCVVLGRLGERLVVHPKYVRSEAPSRWSMLGSYWERVSNPLDPRRSNDTVSDTSLSPYGKRDFVLVEPAARTFHAFAAPSYGTSNAHLRMTSELAHLLSQAIGGPVGIAGGALLGYGAEGFSDIDLVLRRKDFHRLRDALGNIPGVRFRTCDEWRKFYEAYRVTCGIDADTFARHMVHKCDQFIFRDVPVSLFFVDDRLQEYEIFPEGGSNVQLVGTVKDDARGMLLPATYEVSCPEDIEVRCEERAYLTQANSGQVVRIAGFKSDGRVYIRAASEDFMVVLE